MPESMRRPLIRFLWLPGFGFGLGDGSYYGWRWWISVGPLVILMGRADV